jgi:LmbE family N-acetylglucosaminyl deacetylase
MQVLAHPDDDLYFMNPDTVGGIDRGVPIASVYVTGGGSFGVNLMPGKPRPRANVPAYVSSRQQGLRQAYAQMLGAPVFTPWQRTVLRLPHGGQAEVYALSNGGRSAQLVFLNIDMHTETIDGTVNMAQLWWKPGAAVRTVVVPGSPVHKAHFYQRQTLIDSLVQIFDLYRPTMIRTLDPDPDIQVHDALHPRDSDQVGYSDHADHTAVALFTWRAMAQWVDQSAAGGGKVPAFLTDAYRGYYNQRWAHNLPQDIVLMKARLLDTYGGNPAWHCGDAQGCGDYAIGQGSVLRQPRGWARSTHYRYPTAGPRVTRAKDGRLTAYGVLSTRAARWTQTSTEGGAWGPPEDLGGGPLAPALSVVPGPDGHDLVFALRFSGLEGDPYANTREIVLLEGTASGHPATSAWRSLGNPEQTAVRGRRVGPPTALLGKDGRLHVFVRNAAKGLSTRVRDSAGNWSPWRALDGGQVQEGLTAALDGLGRIHVFAAGFDCVHEWTQATPHGDLRYAPLKVAAPPGEAPDAVTGPGGSLLLAYRLPDTAELVVEKLTTAGGRNRWTPAARLRDSGFGPVSLLPGQRSAEAEPLVAVRAGLGAAQLLNSGRTTAPLSAAAITAYAVGRPALFDAGQGRPTVVSFGLDAMPGDTGAPAAGTFAQSAGPGAAARR